MKVSVCITTFNHEMFIEQALDSVLMQEVDFDYEVIIGEDDSSDNTRNIVKAYKEKYPNKIRLFLNDRKNIIYIDGKPTGRWNFLNNLQNSRGQYIALLDGDDFWTSKHKLQKQVDFMEDHTECAICFHNALLLDNDENVGKTMLPDNFKKISSLEDLLHGNFIPTCSTLFRNHLFSEFPEWYLKIRMGDWPLHILNAQFGKIGYINEVMGCYRKHKGSNWSSKKLVDQYLLSNTACNYFKRLFHGNDRYLEIIDSTIKEYNTIIAQEYKNSGDYLKYIFHRLRS